MERNDVVASQIEFTDGERQNSLRSMTEDYGTYRSSGMNFLFRFVR